jgi:4-hydroxy-2-oxoheptanedioate aldolase
MLDNPARRALRDGRTVVVCFSRSPDPYLVELAALCGFDAVLVDCEHGPAGPYEFEQAARAIEVRGVPPFVRVPDDVAATLLRFCDAGAVGVHVPKVESAAQAEAIGAALRFGPLGRRGLAGTRASGYSQLEPIADYTARANEALLLVAQVETAEGVAAAPAIAAVDAVDVLFVGPTDLSHSLGVTGQLDHPLVTEAIDRIIEAAEDAGTPWGIFVGTEAAAHRWTERGARYVAVGLEGLLVPSLRRFVQEVRP